MKTKLFLKIAAIVISGFALLLVVNTDYTSGQVRQDQKRDNNFEVYREAIKYLYKIDIANFKDKISGGLADGKPITNYDLGQLLEGIKEERDHTSDNMLALELAMDHLEHFPDYYTHLVRMEKQKASEKILAE
jgi:hypothetical protein